MDLSRPTGSTDPVSLSDTPRLASSGDSPWLVAVSFLVTVPVAAAIVSDPPVVGNHSVLLA